MRDPLLSSESTIQAIIVLGGIITTWITLKYKDRIQSRLRSRQPKDRMETIFDGYERLIKDLQSDVKRVRETNEDQHKEIIVAQDKITELESELKEARKENRRLMDRLRNAESRGVV